MLANKNVLAKIGADPIENRQSVAFVTIKINWQDLLSVGECGQSICGGCFCSRAGEVDRLKKHALLILLSLLGRPEFDAIDTEFR